MKVLQDEIKAEIGNRNAEEVTAGDYTVRFTRVTRSIFDSKYFKVDHPRRYKKYMGESESRRFSIV